MLETYILQYLRITLYPAKTKALISYTVTMQLICAFALLYLTLTGLNIFHFYLFYNIKKLINV